MYNKLVEIFYRTSLIIPFIFIMGISNLLGNSKNYYIGISLLVFAVILSFLHIWFLSKSKKILVKKTINITNIEKKSNEWIIVLCMSYLIPFLNKIPKINEYLVYKNFDTYTIVVYIIVFIIIILNKNISNNMILIILGYKSYTISTKQGVNMDLLSKRELRNINEISKCIRIFENLIMEVD